MFLPHEFKPIGNYCLIRLIDQSLSASVILPPKDSRRNFIATLVSHGPRFRSAVANESVMVPWMWKTEPDSFFFAPPFERYGIIPSHRIRAVITGEAHRRRVVPIGAHYLVKQIPEAHVGSLIIPSAHRQSLDFEVVRRGRAIQDAEGKWHSCGDDLEPGMRGRITEWQQTHVEVSCDDGECLLIPQSDIMYFHEKQ